MLQVKNITRKIDKKIILDDISLNLESGKIISVIGPSGAGKTSLLKTIALIDLADSGSLRINNFKYKFPIKKK